MAPEGKGQDNRIEQGVYGREWCERMEPLAPGNIDGLAMLGRYVDLAQECRVKIGQAHARPHPRARPFWPQLPGGAWQNLVYNPSRRSEILSRSVSGGQD